MDELIERLEKATGPDRELNAAIAKIEGHELHDDFWMRVPSTMEAGYSALAPIPSYTSSIDAALTLVPEGKAWAVSMQLHYFGDGWKDESGRMMAYADVRPLKSPVNIDEIHETTAATPALALCIAALKARKAQP